MKNKDKIFDKIIFSNGENLIFDKDSNIEFVSAKDYIEGKHTKSNISAELQYKLNEHSKLCDGLKGLYATKNADYGDSMHPLFEEYGLTAFLVLFGIKIQRIKNLSETGNKQHYESITDSLYDLANYALIAITELKAKEYKELKDILNKSND